MIIKGIPACSGIASANAFVLKRPKIVVDKKPHKSQDTANVLVAFDNAKAKVIHNLEHSYNLALKKLGKKDAAIFEAHIMMCDDPELRNDLETLINEEH